MWDEVYSGKDYAYGKTPNDFLRDNYQQIPNKKVLCLAEGEGRNAVFLAQQGYQVTAVDLSAVGLQKAQKLAAEKNVHIQTIVADLNHFDLGKAQWDGIVSIFCHLPPEMRKQLFHRVEKALKPNGILLLEAYRPEQLNYQSGGPSKEEMLISKQHLQTELANLNFKHLLEIDRNVVEGSHHSGRAAVVQAIAEKQANG